MDAFDRVYYLDDDAIPLYFDDDFRTFRLDLSDGGVPRRRYVEQVAFTPRNPCHHQHKEWKARFGTDKLTGGGAPWEPLPQGDDVTATPGEPPKAGEPPPKDEGAANDVPPKDKPEVPKVALPLPEAMMNDDLVAVMKGSLSPDQIEVVALRWRTQLLQWLPAFLEKHPELKEDHPFRKMLTNWRMKK